MRCHRGRAATKQMAPNPLRPRVYPRMERGRDGGWPGCMARKRARADVVPSDERVDKARRPASPVPLGAGGGLRMAVLASLERAPPFLRSAALPCSPGAARATPWPFADRPLGLPRHDPACCVVAPRRCAETSTASRRLASAAVAQATRPTGVFQQPASLP